jgi:hypothetical protein
MASRGRLTKMEESIVSAPIETGRHRTCLNRLPGTNALETLYNNLLAALQSLVDNDIRSVFAADLYSFHDGLAVLNNKHVDTFLIRDQCACGTTTCPAGLGIVARTVTVSVARSTDTSTKLIAPIWL